MRLNQSILTIGCVAAVVVAAASFRPAIAADPTAANGPTTQPTQRSIEQIGNDIQALQGDLMKVVSPTSLVDPNRRAAQRDQALPILHRFSALIDEMAATPQGANDAVKARIQIISLLLIYGDEATQKDVQSRAAGSGQDAIDAKSELLFSRWITSAGNAAQQTKVADETIALAEQNKSSDMIGNMINSMAEVGNGSPENVKRLQDELTNNMTTPLAMQAKAQMQAAETLAAMENKPLVISGITKDGSNLTTADWKGRVILVDFWASWCGPCRGETPRVEKMYSDYHAKGLEVLGVSCDNTAGALNGYLKENPGMAWPQLWDAKTPGWHPLAKQFGIDGIPTMFLIDRKGVVRSVKARENMETLIPQLLAESPQ
jgi:thiol-disulfide isomerase/thioredoxin